MRNRLIELIKYGIYGCITTAINLFLLFFFIKELGMHYLLSNSVSYAIAVVINYIFNKKYVFKTDGSTVNSTRIEFIKFVSVRIASLFADNALLYLIVDVIKIDLLVGKILSSLIIILSTFVLNKVFVFRKTGN